MSRFTKLNCAILLMLVAAPCAVYAQMGYAIGTWAASPVPAPAGSAGKVDETLREIVHVSVGGGQSMHVTLSNEFGVEPLTIGAATVALRTSDDGIEVPVALTFGGNPGVVIPPGKLVESDEVKFAFPPMSDLAVSLFIPAQTLTTVTQHGFANTTNYDAPGNQVNAKSLVDAKKNASWRYLKGVEIGTATGADIVCLGDSITDGSKSTKDANLRWPDLLAARLLANSLTVNLGVLNEGIGGNRILHDVTGPSAMARFERDVLGHPYGRYLVILEGINDIGHAADPDPAKRYDVVSADDLIAGYQYLVARAHAHGMKVIGATLTPYMGAKYASPQGEEIRTALNTWIRTTKELDGVIDFDKAARDPANPSMFLPAYDSGDDLHPNDAGMKAMADAIDLSLFSKGNDRVKVSATPPKK
jgi:lysophospholipase L1-like esterase